MGPDVSSVYFHKLVEFWNPGTICRTIVYPFVRGDKHDLSPILRLAVSRCSRGQGTSSCPTGHQEVMNQHELEIELETIASQDEKSDGPIVNCT